MLTQGGDLPCHDKYDPVLWGIWIYLGAIWAAAERVGNSMALNKVMQVDF